MRRSVDELPGVGAIEVADPDRSNQARVEAAKVYAVLGTWRWAQRLPVRDAPARFAVNGAERFIAPDVCGSCFWVGFYLDGAKLEVDPRAANAPAKRAIASGGYFWCGWQCHSNGAAVA